MDIKKENIIINETVMRSNEKVLVSGDIIVPDVKSDIAKVLKIDADAMVESCSFSGGRLEIGGRIYLTILYVPENDAKPVCAIATDMPFETRIEDSRLTDGVKCICTPDVYNVEFNVLNPRKLSVKTVIDLKISAANSREEEFLVSLDGEGFETLGGEANIYSLVCFKNTKFTLEEVLDFPSGKPSGTALLKTDVKLVDYQIHIVTGKIVIKGMAESCTLYISDAGKPEFITHEIPFTEVIDADDVTENSNCDLQLTLCNSMASLRADSDGNMRIIELEMLFAAEATAYEESRISLISDCFSLGGGYVCTQKSVNLERLVYKDEIRHNLKGIVTLSDSLPDIAVVYNLMIKPYAENVSVKDGEVVIDGSCDCYVLYLSEKESTPVCSVMANLPFSVSVNSNEVRAGNQATALAKLSSCSYNISLSGEIEIRAALDLSLTVTEQYKKDFICDIKPDEAECEKRHGIAVYFTQKGDSLWKIAKRYRVGLKKLIALNRLENPDLIYPGQPILIPMP